jgi:hypothetical protein
VTDHIELVYNRLVADEKLKTGTKYEKLAAIVFRILTEQTTVHDLRLRGDVGVPHQIDVTVGEERRRILIEAKDYDRKVDLPVVVHFSEVVDDLGADEAFVVTTTGFSDNAIKWAEAKDLKLAILRPPKDSDDWGNLLQRIHFCLRFSAPTDPVVTWHADRSEAHRFAGGANPIGGRLIDDVLLVDEHEHLTPFRGLLQPQLDAEQKKLVAGEPGTLSGSHSFVELTWLHLPNEQPIRVVGYEWTQEMVSGQHDFSIGYGVGGLAAELVLRTLDGNVHRIFSNRQIQSWTFDGKNVVSA